MVAVPVRQSANLAEVTHSLAAEIAGQPMRPPGSGRFTDSVTVAAMNARADTLTVSELCRRVGDAMSEAFPDEVWVEGAISGLTRSANGHVYFNLIDPTEQAGQTATAVLPVALFSSSRQLVNRIMRRAGGIRMHDGIEIRIRGQIAYYPPQGRVQLVMSLIDPQYTLGQMAAARQQLLETLTAEGLLDRNHGVPFPALPLRVGLITSDNSAAYHDFINELTASGYPFRVTLFDTRVQGPEAVAGVASAIGAVTAGRVDVDVVVLARGGGARTDLVVFDHERVARAIAACPVPVVVGVGHEIDRSVADEVAQWSLKTPTASARLLVDAVARFEARVDDAAHRLHNLTVLHLDGANARLMAAGGRLAAVARRVIDHQSLALDHAWFRLGQAPARIVARADTTLEVAQARLHALDPSHALRRGWSITYAIGEDEAGHRLVRGPDDVATGTNLETVTAKGVVLSTVTGTRSVGAGPDTGPDSADRPIAPDSQDPPT